MKNIGIYKIESKINPIKIYIGSSVNVNKRFKSHRYKLKKNIHPNKKLQNHYNKYGELDLIFTQLCECDKQYLIVQEQYYIDKLKPFFNIRIIAESNYGLKMTIENKLKHSLIFKGRVITDEWKLNISKALKGNTNGKGKTHKLSDQSKTKISIANKGKKHTVWAKEKISKSLTGYIRPLDEITHLYNNKHGLKITTEINEFIINNIGIMSQYEIGNKFGLHQSTISKHLKKIKLD